MEKSLYQRRIDQGLCGISGCPSRHTEGKSLCPKHQEEARQKAVANRAKRKATGQCIVTGCNKDALTGRTRCASHLREAADAMNEKTAQWKVAGLCVNCGKVPPAPGCVSCQPCIDRSSVNSLADYYRRKADGTTCCYCDRLKEPGYTMCAYHIKATSDRHYRDKIEALTQYCPDCKDSTEHPGPFCVLCGEDDVDVLQIDHIEGGGRKHTKEETGGSGNALYGWLKANGWPEGFRTLCADCNLKCHRNKMNDAPDTATYFRAQYDRDYRLNVKTDVLLHYSPAGSAVPCCVKCGKDDLDILQIDHIEGGGTQHLKNEVGSGGHIFYLWLRRNGLPVGFRTLCSRCNKKEHQDKVKAGLRPKDYLAPAPPPP